MRNSNFKQLSAVLKRNIAFTLAFAVLVWVLSWYVRTATVAFPDFDGALNLNVSQAVLNGEGYGSFYETFAIFPIQTQTNGPLVLPAAASIALLGQQPLAYFVVTLAMSSHFALELVPLGAPSKNAPAGRGYSLHCFA